MTKLAWFLVVWLYVAGFFGIRAMAIKMNGTWPNRLFFWPALVLYAVAGDIFDWIAARYR